MKAKPILIITASIVIGMVAGFIISAQIMRNKIEHMRMLGMEEGFRHRVIYMIDPAEDQLEQIQPIIDKYAKSNAELTHEFGGKLKGQLDDFYKELSPYLSPDQKERLKRIENHRRKYMHKEFRKDHPKEMPFHQGGGACGNNPHDFMLDKKCDFIHDTFWQQMALDSNQEIEIHSAYQKYNELLDSLVENVDDKSKMQKEIMKIRMDRNRTIMETLHADQREVFKKERLP